MITSQRKGGPKTAVNIGLAQNVRIRKREAGDLARVESRQKSVRTLLESADALLELQKRQIKRGKKLTPAQARRMNRIRDEMVAASQPSLRDITKTGETEGKPYPPGVEVGPSLPEKIERLLYNEYDQRGGTLEHIKASVARDMQALGLTEQGRDLIDKAAQYNAGKYEVIEIIDDANLDFYRGQVVKYVLRCTHKGRLLEDLKKSRYYLTRLIRLTENGEGPLVEKDPAFSHG